jgi:hypothetical protein
MTRRVLVFALLATATVACSNNNNTPTSPTTVAPKFTATLLPSNEVPPVTNADSTGSGTVTITFNLTKDSSGNVTAATADFNGTFTGFPNGTTLTAAHIHNGSTGANAGVFVSAGLSPGEVTFPNGSGTLTKTAQPMTVDEANAILANPSAFYFNIHTALNPGGAARGQLTRTQ